MPRGSTDYVKAAHNWRNSSPDLLLFWQSVQKASGALARFRDRVPSFAFLLAIAALLVLSVICSRGGYAQPELEQYIPHYLSDGPFLQKIFDYKKVEIWNSYRPRPLSYAVDDFDVAFIAWSARHGFPHLLSASYYVFWTADCLLLWVFFRRHLRIHRFTAGLLICLLSTDPVLFFHAGYFRSAKPGGTCFLLAAFVVFAECVRAVRRNRSKLLCVGLASLAGVLLLCACLFDEIPAAFALVAAIMLALECFVDRRSRPASAFVYVLTAILAVVAAFAWYDVVGHPKLIWMLTGEKVSMTYQTGTASALLWNPALTVAASVSVFLDTFRDLAGDLPAVLAFLLLLALASIWKSSDRNTGVRNGSRSGQWIVLRLAIGAFLMLGCLYGMISRHPPVMWLNVRQGEYVQPLTMVFVLFVAASLALLQSKYPSRGRLELVLVVLLASNLVSVGTERVFGHWTDQFTRILLASLRNPSAFDAEARESPEIARLQKEVLRSPLYQSLHEAMTGPR